MRLTLAAVGAVVAALLQLTIVRHLRIGGAQPDLVLVFALTTTLVWGLEGGLVLAFLGGLMIDLLTPRPLGVTAFTLLVSVGFASLLGRVLDRARYLAPVVTVFPLSIVNSLLFLLVYGLLRERIPVSDPLRAVLPDAIYSTAVAAVVGTIAVVIRARAAERERVAW